MRLNLAVKCRNLQILILSRIKVNRQFFSNRNRKKRNVSCKMAKILIVS